MVGFVVADGVAESPNRSCLCCSIVGIVQLLQDRFGSGISETVAGFLQSSLYTLFFSLCPVFFKALANFESSASSVASAELRALQYFWWYMVVSAFWGTLIANMFLAALNGGFGDGELSRLLLQMARAIPATTGKLLFGSLSQSHEVLSPRASS